MSPWQPSFETEDSIGRQFKSRFCLISSRNCIRNLSDAEMFSLMSNWSPLYLPQSRILGLPPPSRQGQSVEGQARGRREEGEKKGREEKGRGEGREGTGRGREREGRAGPTNRPPPDRLSQGPHCSSCSITSPLHRPLVPGPLLAFLSPEHLPLASRFPAPHICRLLMAPILEVHPMSPFCPSPPPQSMVS